MKYLEAIHIFSLSNLLRRPIIVLADTCIRNLDDEEISVNDLYGIYLPILHLPKDCCRDPIVLAYDQYHFCPLQTHQYYEGYQHENMLPLYPSKTHVLEEILLPIRFADHDLTKEAQYQVMSQFLRLQTISFHYDGNPTPVRILCA